MTTEAGTEGGLLGSIFRRQRTEPGPNNEDAIYDSAFPTTTQSAILTMFHPPMSIATLPTIPTSSDQLHALLGIARSGEDVTRAVYWFKKSR